VKRGPKGPRIDYSKALEEMRALVLAGEMVKAAARQVENLVTGSRSNNTVDRLRHLFGKRRDELIADYHEREAHLDRAIDQLIRDVYRLCLQFEEELEALMEAERRCETVTHRIYRLDRLAQLFDPFCRLDQMIRKEVHALIYAADDKRLCETVTRSCWLLGQQIREELQALNSETVPVPDP
jgi:DNA repair ATPase RecN